MQKSHKESRYYPNNFQLQDSKAHPPRLRTVHMQVREGLTKILESSIFSQKVLPQQHILRYMRFFNISEFQQSTAHQLNQGRCSSTVSLNFISCIIAMFCSTVFVQIQSDSNSPIKSFITWCNSLQDHCHTLTLHQGQQQQKPLLKTLLQGQQQQKLLLKTLLQGQQQQKPLLKTLLPAMTSSKTLPIFLKNRQPSTQEKTLIP